MKFNTYNTDGFNERTNFIYNSNDKNKLDTSGPSNFDNSFAKMRTEERRDLVETTKNESTQFIDETKGNKDNFILRDNNMRQVNAKPMINDPVSNALNRNLFKR